MKHEAKDGQTKKPSMKNKKKWYEPSFGWGTVALVVGVIWAGPILGGSFGTPGTSGYQSLGVRLAASAILSAGVIALYGGFRLHAHLTHKAEAKPKAKPEAKQ